MSHTALTDRPLPHPTPKLALTAVRALVAVAVIVTVHVAASLAQARHAGWVAAGLGVPLGLAAALAVRRVPAGLIQTEAAARPLAPARPGLLLPATAALFLIALAPLLTTRFPPFDDYLNHLARIHVIALGDAPSPLHAFYAIHWKLIPNLAMDIIVPPLARAIGIFAAGKLFLIMAMLLLLSGPFAIARAMHGQWSPGPLLATLFIVNYVSKMGVVNYEFGVGLALFAIAAWIALRERPAWLRGIVSTGFVAALFLSHLVALGLYGVAIASIEIARLRARPEQRRHPVADAAALLLPFVVALPMLASGWGGAHSAIPWRWGGIHSRLEGLRMLVEGYAPRLDLLFLLGMVAGLAWALRRRVVSLPAAGWVFLALGGAVFLILPNWAQGSWGAAARMPTGMAFVLCGMLRWDLPSARAQRAFLAVVAALLLFRTATAEAAFLRYDRVARDVSASLTLIPPGSRILVAADYTDDDNALRAIRELPCLAVITRASLVSIEYSDPPGQILVVKPPYRAMTGGTTDDPVALPDLLHPPPHDMPPMTLDYDPSGRVYWRDWPRDYDYVYVMNRQAPASPDPARLDLLYTGDRVQLFRVRRD